MGEPEGKREALRLLEARLERQGEEIERQRARIEELEREVAEWRARFDAARREYEAEVKRLREALESIEEVSREKKKLEMLLEEEKLRFRRLEEDKKLSEEALRSEISRLRGEILTREGKIGELEGEVAYLKERVSGLEGEKSKLKDVLGSLEKLIEGDINYKPYFILKSIGECKIGDLSKTMGVSEGQVRLLLARMERMGIVRLDGEKVRLNEALFSGERD
ncbi:MAG: hypothetical protein QXZ06_00275 [Candidatus Jordarchaeales archaeon]